MNPKPNILIVDDIEVNLFLLEAIMKKVDVTLIKAFTGFEALEKTRGIELALALVDVWMPGMNGYDLAVKLNEDRLEDKVPVIFLTANYGNETEIFKGYDSGAVDYIIKPINNEILLSKINVFLDLFNHEQTIIRNAALLKESAEELTRVNEALKKSEEKYRSYIDNAPDGVFITDENGKFKEVNDAASAITGYSTFELLQMSFSDFIQKEWSKDGMDYFRELVNNGSAKSDLLFKHKNGSNRWWSVEAVKLTEAQFLCFTKDITDKKRAEEELQSSLEQLHQLTQYIDKVRENERVAISRELHDDLGQALTAVKIDLGIIKQNVSDSDVLFRINKVSELVRDTIITVQRLTSQLRPQIIDDLGLEAAIEWYTNEFAQRNGLEVILHIDSGISISPDASLTVFRIMQESLTNISRYAKAGRVDLWLCKSGGNYIFTISDDGIGITENKIKSKTSFGIIGMKERAAALGGSFEIYPGNEKGTEIKIVFPLNYKRNYEDINL
jgi:PAS domain S-box-containing protein